MDLGKPEKRLRLGRTDELEMIEPPQETTPVPPSAATDTADA